MRILLAVAAHDFVVHRPELLGDRADAAGAHRLLVHRGQPGDLGAGAAEEGLFADVQLGAVDGPLHHRDLQLVAGQLDDGVAGDPFQQAGVDRRRDQLAPADDEDVLGAAFGHLALGVEQFELEPHEAHVGPAHGGAGVEHGRAQGKLVVGPDRQQPPHLVDTRRAHRAGIEHEGIGAHPHQDAAEIPAGGGETAQHGVLGNSLVEMHRLGVEFGRECDHLAAWDAPRAMLEDAAWREVFPMELRHGRAFE